MIGENRDPKCVNYAEEKRIQQTSNAPPVHNIKYFAVTDRAGVHISRPISKLRVL